MTSTRTYPWPLAVASAAAISLAAITGFASPASAAVAPVTLPQSIVESTGTLGSWTFKNDNSAACGTFVGTKQLTLCEASTGAQSDAFDGAAKVSITATGVSKVGVAAPGTVMTGEGAIVDGVELDSNAVTHGHLTTRMSYRALPEYDALQVVLRLDSTMADTVQVDFEHDLGSDAYTQVVATSSGDNTISWSNDYWTTTDDGDLNGGDPAVTFIWGGHGSLAGVPSGSSSYFGAVLDQQSYVPFDAPGTKYMVWYYQLSGTAAGAAAKRDALLSDVREAPYTRLRETAIFPAGGTDAELTTVANWQLFQPPVVNPPLPQPPAPANPGTTDKSGYTMVGRDGSVYAFGDAHHYGAPTDAIAPVLGYGVEAVDLEQTPSRDGYWVVDSVGRVSNYGDAAHYGNVGDGHLLAGERVTSISSTIDGGGYWIFTDRGRVTAYGNATHHGDMSGQTLNGPVLDSIPTASGQGYYMVASDGGIFTFGDAAFLGSMGGITLNQPVQSLVPDGDGVGYWLVASDGGIFAFSAEFRGSMGASALNRPITGMVRFGNGYLMVGEDGGIFTFSDRPFHGSLGANPPEHAITSVSAL